ncbi:hypothetical protein BpHYR1_007957 [Brachionus plicatilis]|uniref:MULE transposase domain-containing protein n=1 Tax=Brachionus plicatilis TaxID=10195 RepID=A0A3M7QA83_BRAPC|nr:hypothetical protein BpHYR1_007957 [Brachionus plicatilis]
MEKIFCSMMHNSKRLEKAHIFADGTFDIGPKLFIQVYSVHGLINGRCFSMAYALMSRKKEEMYIEFLDKLKTKLSIDPNSITSDFVKAFLNAASKVFTGVTLFGCLFHFKQAIWKKIL